MFGLCHIKRFVYKKVPMVRKMSSSAQGRVSLVFPGQGAQYVGMAADLAQEFPCARYVLQEADESIKFKLSRLMESGSQEDLKLTINAQPALLVHSMAILEILKHEAGFEVALEASTVLGHSLGEFTALTSASFFSLSDAVRVVRARGEMMQRCIAPSQSAMYALMPIKAETAFKRASEASEATGLVCDVANINAPNQVVISGHAEAVSNCAALCLKHKEARRAIPLEVSAPFHSRLMKPAADGLKQVLDVGFEHKDVFQPISCKAPSVPIISNVTAEMVLDVDTIKSLLVTQTTSPVRWLDSVRCAIQHGTSQFLEIGAGPVLTNLIKSIQPDVEARNLKTARDVKEYLRQRG